MQRSALPRAAALALAALALTAGCRTHPGPGGAAVVHNQPALATGFGDAPLLANVPAETPYVFASFQALPPGIWNRLLGMYAPLVRSLTQQAAQNEGAQEFRAFMNALAAELPSYDQAGLDRVGIAPAGRFVIYGHGAYPILRLELSDGDRLLAAVTRVAQRIGQPVPAPQQAGDRRYWTIPAVDAGLTVVVAIAPRELIVAAVPPAVLARDQALVLGLKRPARSLDPQVLREVARRGGYAPYGVGFADLRHVTSALTAATGTVVPAACGRTIDAIHTRIPRVTAGYGDFTDNQLALGYRLELAPDLATDVQALATRIVVAPPLPGRPALMHLTAAADLTRARALASRGADVLTVIGTACGVPSVVEAGRGLADAAAKPLPPEWSTVRGGSAALYGLELGSNGAQVQVDASGVLTFGDTAGLVPSIQAVARDARADGQVRVGPPLPFTTTIHYAITGTAVAVGVGKGSREAVATAIAARATPAPLFSISYDMRGLMAMMAPGLAQMPPAERQMMQAIYSSFGDIGMDLTADADGVAIWTRMELLAPQP